MEKLLGYINEASYILAMLSKAAFFLAAGYLLCELAQGVDSYTTFYKDLLATVLGV